MIAKELQLSISENIGGDIIYFEQNMFRLPLFFVNKKDAGSQKVLYIPIKTKEGEGYWKVSPNVEFGAGGPFTDVVLAALNKIFSLKQKPLTNPIDIGSLRGIAKIIGLSDQGGFILEKIKTEIKRLSSLLIISKFTFFDKDKGRYLSEVDGVFHILDNAVFIGERLGDSVSDRNMVWLSDKYLRSINAWYVSPVDIDFYLKLKNTERALFRVLAVRFFANRKNSSPVILKYSTICALTTLMQRSSLSLAKQQLDSSHASLVKRGYLLKYEWKSIPMTKEDWCLYYWPGPLAEKYISIAGRENILTLDYDIELFSDETKTKAMLDTSSNSSAYNSDEVLKKLWDRGVLKTTAQALIMKYPLDFLLDVISYCDIIAQTKEINPQYIVKTIEETSPEYINTFLERYRQGEIDKQKAENAVKKKRLKEKYEKDMSKRILDYINSLPAEKQEELKQQAIRENKGLLIATPGNASYEETLYKAVEEIVKREKLIALPSLSAVSRE